MDGFWLKSCNVYPSISHSLMNMNQGQILRPPKDSLGFPSSLLLAWAIWFRLEGGNGSWSTFFWFRLLDSDWNHCNFRLPGWSCPSLFPDQVTVTNFFGRESRLNLIFQVVLRTLTLPSQNMPLSHHFVNWGKHLLFLAASHVSLHTARLTSLSSCHVCLPPEDIEYWRIVVAFLGSWGPTQTGVTVVQTFWCHLFKRWSFLNEIP